MMVLDKQHHKSLKNTHPEETIMNKQDIFDYLGSEATEEKVVEWYGKMSYSEILDDLNESWPQEDNSELADAIFEFVESING